MRHQRTLRGHHGTRFAALPKAPPTSSPEAPIGISQPRRVFYRLRSLLPWSTAFSSLLPGAEPATLVRLAFYTGGLACFAGVQILGPYLRAGLNRHYGILEMFLCLAVGLAFFY